MSVHANTHSRVWSKKCTGLCSVHILEDRIFFSSLYSESFLFVKFLYNSAFLISSIDFCHIFCLFLAQQPPVGHGLLIHGVSRSHTTTHHSREDSSGRVVSSSQRHLPDNTQHSKQTSMSPVGFEPTISAGERQQTYALDRAATGTGCPSTYTNILTTAKNFRLTDLKY